MTVANSRDERGKAIARLAGASHVGLLRELEAWTIAHGEIAEEGRELNHRRSESRTMLELIAVELRTRHAAAAPPVAVPEAIA